MTACKFIFAAIIALIPVGRVRAQSSAKVAKQYNKMAHEALAYSQHHRKDSTTMYDYAVKAIVYALKCDSTEAESGSKEAKFRNDNRHKFAKVRRSLLAGGDYFISHYHADKAGQLLHLYLSSASSPLFYGTPTDTAAAAYMLSTIALKQKDYKQADHWATLALTDTRTAMPAAEVIAMVMEATMSTKADSAAYAEVLTKLYQTNPENKRYFTWLMNFYENSNQRQNLEDFIDRQLATHPDDIMPWILKAELAMKSKRWVEAADTYRQIIEKGVETAPIMYNMGVCLTNISTEEAPSGVKPLDPKECLQEAADYLNKAKKLDPERKLVDWKPVLDAVEKALNDNSEQEKDNQG